MPSAPQTIALVEQARALRSGEWSVEDDAVLRKMWMAGASLTEIGERLRRTTLSVKHHRPHLGLSARRQMPDPDSLKSKRLARAAEKALALAPEPRPSLGRTHRPERGLGPLPAGHPITCGAIGLQPWADC